MLKKVTLDVLIAMAAAAYVEFILTKRQKARYENNVIPFPKRTKNGK